MTDTIGQLTVQQRADIATARGKLWRAARNLDSIDFDTAASMLDRVVATACPHDPADDDATEPDTAGRPITTCYGCRMSWYSDYADRL